MRPSDSDLVSLGPWPQGANNVARETSVPRAAFRAGVNVDLSSDGKVRRREGYALVEGGEIDSVVGAGDRGYFASRGSLYGFSVINGQIGAIVELAQGVRAGARLVLVRIEPDLFVSDGVSNFRITPDNQVLPWSVPTPPAPALSRTPEAGGMQAGRYGVAVTQRNSTGEESGPSYSYIDLEQGDRLTVNKPLPTGTFIVYLTKPNGTEFLFAGTIPSSASAVNFSAQRLGRPCATENLDPLPAADFAAYFRGRLLVAHGNELTASQPMHYSLADLAYDVIEFAEPITGIGVAGDAGVGFFVGQESTTYFVRGEQMNEMRLTEVYPAGIVAGTLTNVPGAHLPLEAPPHQQLPAWLATNGVFCVGMPDGSVLPITETRFAAHVGTSGAALLRQRHGQTTFVATTQEPRENAFAVRDTVTIEIVNNGIQGR